MTRRRNDEKMTRSRIRVRQSTICALCMSGVSARHSSVRLNAMAFARLRRCDSSSSLGWNVTRWCERPSYAQSATSELQSVAVAHIWGGGAVA
eukprot:6205451-Pleurochrysis_carterae.AAC.3